MAPSLRSCRMAVVVVGVDVPLLSCNLRSSCKSMRPRPEGSLSNSRLGKSQQPPLCRSFGNSTQVSQCISEARDRRSDRCRRKPHTPPASVSRTEKQRQSAELPHQVYSAESFSMRFQEPCVPGHRFPGFPEQAFGGEQSKGGPTCL